MITAIKINGKQRPSQGVPTVLDPSGSVSLAADDCKGEKGILPLVEFDSELTELKLPSPCRTRKRSPTLDFNTGDKSIATAVLQKCRQERGQPNYQR